MVYFNIKRDASPIYKLDFNLYSLRDFSMLSSLCSQILALAAANPAISSLPGLLN